MKIFKPRPAKSGRKPSRRIRSMLDAQSQQHRLEREQKKFEREQKKFEAANKRIEREKAEAEALKLREANRAERARQNQAECDRKEDERVARLRGGRPPKVLYRTDGSIAGVIPERKPVLSPAPLVAPEPGTFRCGPDGKPEYLTKNHVDSSTGNITSAPVFNRDGGPVNAHPPTAAQEMLNPFAAGAADSRYPIWVREKRQPTKEELVAAHTGARAEHRALSPMEQYIIEFHRGGDGGNGAGNVSEPNGVRTPAPEAHLVGPWGDGWRHGGNWTKQL